MKPLLLADDPLVKQAFQGIYKSKKLFFKIDPITGDHLQINMGQILNSLNITWDNRDDLMRSYPFEELAFNSLRMQAVAAVNEARKARPARKRHVENGDEEDDQTSDSDEVDDSKESKRYSLVTQSNGYFGSYDGREGHLALFKTRSEAQEYIRQQLSGKSILSQFYAGNRQL